MSEDEEEIEALKKYVARAWKERDAWKRLALAERRLRECNPESDWQLQGAGVEVVRARDALAELGIDPAGDPPMTNAEVDALLQNA